MKSFLVVFLLVVLFSVVGCAPSKSEKTVMSDDGKFVPTKDISLIVGFDAGGAADIPARIVAKYMSEYSDVNIIVTNMAGSSGRIAANHVQNLDPDGHTFLHIPVGYFLQNALGNADFSYKDFETVTMWCDSWVGLVVRGDAPYDTYAEFIQYAKENPGEIKAGAVSGTLPQLATLAISQKENVEFNMVDLGSNNKSTELLSSRIDGYIDAVGQYKQYVESGEFKCLAIFSYEETEVPGYAGVPSVQSLGYSDFDYLLQSFGMWAPKGTSEGAIEYMTELVEKISKDPDCIAELNALGYGPRYETSADYEKICEKVLNGTKNAVESILE